MNWFYKKIKGYSKKDGPFPILLILIYQLCRSPVLKAAFIIILTFIISLLVKIANWDSNEDLLMQILHYKKLMFFMITYILFAIGCAIAEEYNKTSFKESTVRNEINDYLLGVMNKRITTLQEFIEDIDVDNNSELSRINFVQGFLKYSDFQVNARSTCSRIYNFIAKHFDSKQHQVTLMVRGIAEVDGREREITKMIAFGTHHDQCPSSFNETYPIDTIPEYYHQKIFQINSRDVAILANIDEVKNAFKFNPKSERREKCINQYIGIPLFLPLTSNEMFGLLQIDAPSKVFGNNRENIEEYVNRVLQPFQVTLILDFLRQVTGHHLASFCFPDEEEINITEAETSGVNI